MSLFAAFFKKSNLKVVSREVLAPTLGDRRIAEAHSVFRVIDKGFSRLKPYKPNKPSPTTLVLFLELKRDGTFREIFEEYIPKELKKARNLKRLCLTEDQIILFVETYALTLARKGKPIFFLFENDGAYCVAGIMPKNETFLDVEFFLLDYLSPWLAEFGPHFVVPDGHDAS